MGAKAEEFEFEKQPPKPTIQGARVVHGWRAFREYNDEQDNAQQEPLLANGKKISKKEAESKNMTTYFDGNPCKKGHIADKYVRNQHCKTCCAINGKEYKKGRRNDKKS